MAKTIRSIDVSGGSTTIAYTDGSVEHFEADGYQAMLNCRAADPRWNVPAASGRRSDMEALVAEIKRMTVAP